MDVWKHIRELGLGALAHANMVAAYAPIPNSNWPDLSVIQSAHAAELLIKARIAQEHPLLIFERLPSFRRASVAHLDLKSLFDEGRTLQWSDLPDRLWAATGITIPGKQEFERFGKLRNGIQHFGPAPEVDSSLEALRFIYGVIDPFINECWGLFAINYDEETERYIFVPTLLNKEILFLVPPEAAESFESWKSELSGSSKGYQNEMLSRMRAAAVSKS